MHIITFYRRYFDLLFASQLRPAVIWFFAEKFEQRSSCSHNRSALARANQLDWQINIKGVGMNHQQEMYSFVCICTYVYVYKCVRPNTSTDKLLMFVLFFFFAFFVCIAWSYNFRFTSASLWAISVLAKLEKWILLSVFLIELT